MSYKQVFMLDPCEKLLLSFFGLQIRKQERADSALDFRIASHDIEIRSDVGREFGFNDEKQFAGADEFRRNRRESSDWKATWPTSSEGRSCCRYLW